jgi:hypothetical protein
MRTVVYRHVSVSLRLDRAVHFSHDDGREAIHKGLHFRHKYYLTNPSDCTCCESPPASRLVPRLAFSEGSAPAYGVLAASRLVGVRRHREPSDRLRERERFRAFDPSHQCPTCSLFVFKTGGTGKRAVKTSHGPEPAPPRETYRSSTRHGHPSHRVASRSVVASGVSTQVPPMAPQRGANGHDHNFPRNNSR